MILSMSLVGIHPLDVNSSILVLTEQREREFEADRGERESVCESENYKNEASYSLSEGQKKSKPNGATNPA